jgi:F5/8 type C domain
MRKHAKRGRSFAPNLTVLEPRRLLSFAATWIGQDGSDFTGTEGLINPQRPNDYQDIHLRFTGLSDLPVVRVAVTKPVRGGWNSGPVGDWTNAVYRPDPTNPGTGDFYMEPDGPDPAGTLYDSIRVTYADGSTDVTWLRTGSAVDPNLRTPGTQVSAVFVGQVPQDWTGPNIGVGPDGYQDVQLALSNLSAGATCFVTVTAATNPPRIWESGVNPNGRWNAELMNRTGQNGTLGTTADLFFSSDVNLAGVPLTIVVTYAHQNPDASYTNRSGRTDTVVITAGATNPTLAMPAVAESNLPQARAASLPQDAAAPGNSHAALDAASLAALPSGQSFATVRSAVLSNLYGSSWIYARSGTPAPYPGGMNPLTMLYNPTTGVFDFPPVRDEDGSTLTLLLTFNDGSQAVARFVGATSDVGRRVADPRVGASVQNVSSAADLLAALQAHASNIHLTAGSYVLNAPLNLNYPIRITADPGITLTFALSNGAGSPWNSAPGAILVSSSHVALDGFAIRFQGTTAMWTSGVRVVVQAGFGDANVDLSFTHLDVQAPAAAVTTGYEGAVPLMIFDPGDSGVIANNILRGGWIQLGTGPWTVLGNDYQGAVANTITPTFLNVYTSHDLTIVGNHAHQVDPAGIAQRFLVFGNADKGQGIGNRIENNTIDGGIGTPVNAAIPNGYGNNPEIILLETYQPRFEGKPSAVSPDGFIVQVPYLRGPEARTGDVVSIVTGPYAGQWRMIAQALSPTRYLLADPLPPGDYVITIGRGFVDQTYRGNVIDVRGMSPNNIGVVISGNDWGSSIVGNTFLGGMGLRIGAGSSEGSFVGPNGAPWGWSRLPVLDLAIDGNLFGDASVWLGVAHDQLYNKASAGRTYFTGDFSNNEIRWSNAGAPAVTIGMGPDPSRGAPAYTLANFPWLSLDELRLTVRNNWGSGGSTGAPPTLKVYAATLNGVGADDQTISLSPPPAGGVEAEWIDSSGARWIQYSPAFTMPQIYTLTKIIRASNAAGAGGQTAWSWLLLGSNDGMDWTVLAARPDDSNAPDPSTNVDPTTNTNTPTLPPANVDSTASPTTPPPPANTPTPPVESPAVDLARGKTATSSSDESASYAPGMAVDGNSTTRWSSGQWMRNDSIGWIVVDLGAVYDIDRVTLNWEAAYAVDYQIQVSDDGSNWTTAQSVVGNATGGVLDYANLSTSGRYVRIYCTRFNATNNYSLYDLNVYGA